jgi:hypothetical protein
MLYPHSLLWHYLWVGPHVLQLMLAILLWRRGFPKQFPAFFAYLVCGAAEELTLWTMDVLPLSWVGIVAYWRTAYAGGVIEGLLTLAVVREVFFHLVRAHPARVRLGKRLLILTGAVLVLLAALAAARAAVPPGQPLLIVHVYSLFLGLYMVLSGLILFLFLFASYHGLAWDRRAFGVALGFGIDWCEHTAAFALIASGLRDTRLDFLNMATYHFCVLIWIYFLLSPVRPTSAALAVTLGTQNKQRQSKTTFPPTFRRLWRSWLLSGFDS